MHDVPFSGTYEYDPGVRYYPDGSGCPPSDELLVECDWDESQAHAAVDGEFPGREVLDAIGEVLADSIADRIDDFL